MSVNHLRGLKKDIYLLVPDEGINKDDLQIKLKNESSITKKKFNDYLSYLLDSKILFKIEDKVYKRTYVVERITNVVSVYKNNLDKLPTQDEVFNRMAELGLNRDTFDKLIVELSDTNDESHVLYKNCENGVLDLVWDGW